MVDVAHQEKVLFSNKGPFAGFDSVASVGKRVSSHPKSNASATGVQEIPQEDVFDVLTSNGSCAQLHCIPKTKNSVRVGPSNINDDTKIEVLP
jgi:hypothetical protein